MTEQEFEIAKQCNSYKEFCDLNDKRQSERYNRIRQEEKELKELYKTLEGKYVFGTYNGENYFGQIDIKHQSWVDGGIISIIWPPVLLPEDSEYSVTDSLCFGELSVARQYQDGDIRLATEFEVSKIKKLLKKLDNIVKNGGLLH